MCHVTFSDVVFSSRLVLESRCLGSFCFHVTFGKRVPIEFVQPPEAGLVHLMLSRSVAGAGGSLALVLSGCAFFAAGTPVFST